MCLGCTGQRQGQGAGGIHGPVPEQPDSTAGVGGGGAANHAAWSPSNLLSQVPSWTLAAGVNSGTMSPPAFHPVRVKGAPLRFTVTAAASSQVWTGPLAPSDRRVYGGGQ